MFKHFFNGEPGTASEMNENFRRVVKNRPDGGDYEVDKTIDDYLNPVTEPIPDETTAREDADTALQSNLEQQISDEAGLREDGDLANHNHINSEILYIINGAYKVNRAEYADYFGGSVKSTDSTFASNSHHKIPTEKAIRGYVTGKYPSNRIQSLAYSAAVIKLNAETLSQNQTYYCPPHLKQLYCKLIQIEHTGGATLTVPTGLDMDEKRIVTFSISAEYWLRVGEVTTITTFDQEFNIENSPITTYSSHHTDDDPNVYISEITGVLAETPIPDEKTITFTIILYYADK